jgi:hyaluronoglucosaminidase
MGYRIRHRQPRPRPRQPDRPYRARRLARLALAGPIVGISLAVVLVGSAGAASGTTASTLAGRTAAGQEAWVATDAFVSHPGKTVTPVDLVGHRADAAVTTASQPAALAVAPGGRSLLVANEGADTLSVVDTASGAVTATVKVGLEPDAVAVVPGGAGGHGTALVANFGDGTVTPIDLATERAGTPIPVGHQPDAIGVWATSGTAGTAGTPVGGVALVANFADGTVTPIDLATMQAGPTVSAGSEPDAVGIVPAGATAGTGTGTGTGGQNGSSAAAATALVADFGSDTVIPVDLATMADGPPVGVGGNPTGMAVAADRTAWVVGGGTLTPLTSSAGATSAGAAGSTTTPPAFTAGTPLALPHVGEAVALEGTATAWVALQNGTLAPVDLASGHVGSTVHVGGRPSAVAIPAG